MAFFPVTQSAQDEHGLHEEIENDLLNAIFQQYLIPEFQLPDR